MRYSTLTSLVIVFTLTLYGLSSFLPIESMWGLNHLYFLSVKWKFVYGIFFVVIIYLLFFPVTDKQIATTRDYLDYLLCGRRTRVRILVVLSFVVIFYIFRIKTYFLGDGYTLLSIFSQGESLIRRWAEPGSIFLIRQMQNIMGGYTRETMLMTCQILSITSGAVVVVNFIGIAKIIGTNSSTRLFVFTTLLFSGSMLLFFGYVEYYPLLWAFATTFIHIALYYMKNGKKLWVVLLLFILSLLIHLQAIFYLIGTVYLILIKIMPHLHIAKHNKKYYGYIASVSIIGIIIFVLLLHNTVDLITIFLPILKGPYNAPQYTLLSMFHILDILNQIFVMFPGILVIVLLLLYGNKRFEYDSIAIFLGLLSFGSLLFLIVIDPALGMARDWDLMSLSLLAPILFLLRIISLKCQNIDGRIIIAYALMCILFLSTYVAANEKPPASEKRFESIIRYYDMKDETGWAIYAFYFLNNDKYDKAMDIARYMEKRKIRLDKAYHILALLYSKQGRLQESEKYYLLALSKKQRNPYLLNELGQLYMKEAQNDMALKVLKKAHRIAPALSFITEGVGLAYFKLGYIDSAQAIADTLFLNNSHSPGGYLLRMVIALYRGDKDKAKEHFKEYRGGCGISDKSLRWI